MAPPFPTYDFSNLSLDYSAVELTVKQMYSYLNEKRFDGELKPYTKTVMTEVEPILTAMRFDASDDLDNVSRWKKDCEYAYKLLYPLTN